MVFALRIVHRAAKQERAQQKRALAAIAFDQLRPWRHAHAEQRIRIHQLRFLQQKHRCFLRNDQLIAHLTVQRVGMQRADFRRNVPELLQNAEIAARNHAVRRRNRKRVAPESLKRNAAGTQQSRRQLAPCAAALAAGFAGELSARVRCKRHSNSSQIYSIRRRAIPRRSRALPFPDARLNAQKPFSAPFQSALARRPR